MDFMLKQLLLYMKFVGLSPSVSSSMVFISDWCPPSAPAFSHHITSFSYSVLYSSEWKDQATPPG